MVLLIGLSLQESHDFYGLLVKFESLLNRILLFGLRFRFISQLNMFNEITFRYVMKNLKQNSSSILGPAKTNLFARFL